MIAAPPESKQHLTCENRAPAHDPSPAAPAGGADVEIGRLQQRLERADREARTARGWAWMMFGLAMMSILAVSLLAARLGERQVDEKNAQALLDVRTARSRHDLQQSPVPAPARPAAVQPLTDRAIEPSVAGHSPTPAALPPALTVGQDKRVPEVAPLPPAASSFTSRALPHRPRSPQTSAPRTAAAARPRSGQPAALRGKNAGGGVNPQTVPQRTEHAASVASRSGRNRARPTLARSGRHPSRSMHRYSGWRHGAHHYRRTWRGGRHYRYSRRSARARSWLGRGRRGHTGYAHWRWSAWRHHFRRGHHRSAGRHRRARVSSRAGSAGGAHGGKRR
jgi:hypothetical protein